MIPFDDNKFICHNHIDIINDCLIIREQLGLNNIELALEYLDHIQTCATRALSQGKRMENRMVEYNKSILNLGYVRNRE